MSGDEADTLRRLIANDRIFGVDVARDPPLACIARMNMFLHGDGGSSIYQADTLDHSLPDAPTDTAELKREKAELRKRVRHGGFADVVLTNPPFSKVYERKEPGEAKVLGEYHLAFDHGGGKRKPKSSLKTSVMFIERYCGLLKPGGRMIAVIDDSILGSKSFAQVRSFIRDNFIVRAVVSLPGDAFQRSKARVKTSLIHLEKKRSPADSQPDVFMYYCTAVGVDDSARQRVLASDAEARKLADTEINRVAKLYDLFLKGDTKAKRWTVPSDVVLGDRMDVKSCLAKPARMVKQWKQDGVEVANLGDLVEWVDFDHMPDEDVVITDTAVESVTYLRVKYNGFPEEGDEVSPADTNYPKLFRVHAGDIVFSNINAVHGAIAVIPAELDGLVVSHEFTVCRAKAGRDPRLIWALLRSPQSRADLLLLASGIGRHRVQWENVANLKLPVPPKDAVAEVVRQIAQAEEGERLAAESRRQAQELLESTLHLNTTHARNILAAFKPPK